MNDEEISTLIKASVAEQLTEKLAESPEALEAQFREEAAEIAASRRPSMDRVRALQEAYIERGLSEEQVDLNPPHERPRSIRDWYPPGR